jgi:hypothetical protein
MPRRTLFVLLTLVLSLCPTAALQADIIYQINDQGTTLQNGYMLSGTITTDGTIGTINSANIVAFTLVISNGLNTYNDSGTDSNVLVNGAMATATQLTLPVSSPSGLEQFNLVGAGPQHLNLEYFRSNDGTSSQDDTYFGGAFPSSTFWNDQPTVPALGGGAWVIANVAPSATPEPASVTLMLAGIGGLAGYRLVRGRRRAPPPE